MAKTNITWPKSLPAGLKGRNFQRQSPNRRTRMASGSAIQRRAFPGAPWSTKVTWLMTDGQAQAFMAWVRDVLKDGVYWFNCPLRSPLGYNLHAVRIVEFYDDVTDSGPGLWTISATVELDEEPLAPVGQGEWPDELAYTSQFDITMNRTLPGP